MLKKAIRSKTKKSLPILLTATVLVALLPGAVAQSGPSQPAKPTDPIHLDSAPATALFAHFAIGGGFTTTFTLLNTGDATLTGNLILTAQDGTPLVANFSDGITQATDSNLPLTISAGGTRFVTATPLTASEPTKAGWARVESSGGTLGGVSTFQFATGDNLQTIAGVLASNPVNSATIPLDDDVSVNRYTGYAVANPSSSDTLAIKVQTVNADGTTFPPAAVLTALSLKPGEQKAVFVFEDPAASRTFRGSVVLIEQSGKSFIVVALVQYQGLYTAIPVIPSKAPSIN